MTEKIRKAVKPKFDGLCAMCGCDLGKGWTIWDIIPVQTVVGEGGSMTMINTEIDNLMPVCRYCGALRRRNYDRKMDLEEFRKEVLKSFDYLQKGFMTGGSYNRAIRFGFIVETGIELVFHFEKVAANK